MRCPSPIADEEDRLVALAEYGFADGEREPNLDAIVEITARMFGTPAAAVNLIGRDHAFFAASTGVGEYDMRRSVSFCAHTITQRDALVVLDATADSRFHDNPMVSGPAHFRFYAGVPLRSQSGLALGALCVVDTKSRADFSARDVDQLWALSKLVSDYMELRRFHIASRIGGTRFRQIATTSPDAIICADAEGHITAWNPAAETMFGYPAKHAIGRSIALIMPTPVSSAIYADAQNVLAGDVPRILAERAEFTSLRADGTEFPTEFSPSVWCEDGTFGFCAIVRDISERRSVERKIYHLAHHDQLTDLPNRNVLTQRLADEIAAKKPASVVLLDLDGFKDINDTLGHAIGDAVLKDVAQRLVSSVRPVDTVSRLAGDEFTILIREISDPLRASAVADAAIDALTRPFLIDGHVVEIGASAGIAIYPAHGQDVEELLSSADLALRQAKADGRHSYRLFTSAMREAAIIRRKNDTEMRRAIENNELCLFYQPQVRLIDGSVVGAEALLRWRHPVRGIVSPAAFLPIIESGALATVVGDWVLNTACAQAAQWRGLTAGDFRVGVNLFGAQFRAGDLVNKVQDALDRTGLLAHELELEITENIILSQDEMVLPPLRDFRAMGVGIAFDDYGTGYASLSMLKKFLITRLKIDRSFVQTMCESPEDAAIVRAILYLGKSFGLAVIAEGIETAEQQSALRKKGCAEAQGYLFGRPMPAEEFEATFLMADQKIARA